MVLADLLSLSHFWLITIGFTFISISIIIVIVKKCQNTEFVIHVVLSCIGLALILIGLIFFTDFRLNQLHGILGMNATSLTLTAAIGGILAKSKIKRKDVIKKVHIWWGAIVFLYSIGVLIIGIIVIVKN